MKIQCSILTIIPYLLQYIKLEIDDISVVMTEPQARRLAKYIRSGKPSHLICAEGYGLSVYEGLHIKSFDDKLYICITDLPILDTIQKLLVSTSKLVTYKGYQLI